MPSAGGLLFAPVLIAQGFDFTQNETLGSRHGVEGASLWTTLFVSEVVYCPNYRYDESMSGMEVKE